MKSSEPDWELVVAFINETLEDATGSFFELNEEAVKHFEVVRHLARHSEYEMAFEVLFLEIMKFPKMDFLDGDKVLEFALLLKLDTLTVYDDCFFEKLVSYCTTN